MLYDSYYKKISKIADFWKKVFKHIVLISIILGVVLAALIAFMVTKGIVFDDKSQPDKIELTYGTSLNMDTSALFADVSYEYSTDGGTTWSKIPPTLPGEYKVRAVSKGIFGQDRYGKVYSLMISPKQTEVKVVESEILYGELLSVSADLQYGDTIFCKKFNYADITKETTSVEPDISDVEIINKDGENVTAAYSLVSVKSDVTFLKRDIFVVVEDRGTIYNGVALKYDGYGVVGGTVAEGDILTAEIPQTITNVGEIQGTPELKVRNADFLDVTNHYNIDVEVGKLSVDYRPIIVESLSTKKEYDAKPLSNQQVVIKEGTLANGQEISYIQSSSITDPGKTENVVSFEIRDAQKNNTIDNYSIIYVWGTLEVLPRAITVKTESLIKAEYDGKELKNTEYKISAGSLAEGHTSELIESVSLTNVGEIINAVSIVIKDAEGNDKTANYDISEDFGTITVHPRTLTVSTGSGSWKYDGNYHTTKVNYTNLCEGHEVRTTEPKSVIDVEDGEIQNDVEVLGIYDAEGNEVTENYSVIYGGFGTIKIELRPIEIVFKTVEFIYSGKAYSSAEYENAREVYAALLLNDELHVTMEEFIDANEEGYVNEPIDYVIYSNTRQMPVTDNYDVKITAGKVIIHKFEIHVNFLGDLTEKVKPYDGEPLVLTSGDYELEYPQYPEVYSLPDGHEFIPEFVGSQTDVGTYVGATLDFDNTQINFNGEDAKDNFEITSDKVNLKVEKRALIVATGTESKPYDGTALTNQNYMADGLLDGHKIIYSQNIVSVIDVEKDEYGNLIGTPNEIHVVDILDENGVSVRSNYADETDITYQYGTLMITLRAVEIKTESANLVYDGKSYSFDGFDVVGNTDFVVGENGRKDVLDINVDSFTLANEDGYDNGVNGWSVYSFSRGKDVTENYDISVICGKIIIYRLHLKVVLNDYNDKVKTYDGTVLKLEPEDCRLEFPTDRYSSQVYNSYPVALPRGHVFDPEFIGAQIEVGIYREATLDTVNTLILRDEVDVKENFFIETNKLNLIVLPVAGITFKPADVLGYYNGTPYKPEALEKPDAEYLSNLKELGYEISYSFKGEQTVVNDPANPTRSEVTDIVITRDGVPVTNEFVINCEPGTITVLPQPLFIDFDSLKEKIYDGTALKMTVDDCDIEGLPLNHNIELYFSGTQTVVGEKTAYLDKVEIFYNNEIVDLDNFDIYVNGMAYTDSELAELQNVILKVYRRDIIVKSDSAEKYFDGKPLSKNSWTISSVDLYGNPSDLDKLGFDIDVVLAGSEITQIGTISNEITSITVYVNGVEEVNGVNVNVIKEEGQLTVNKGSVVITVIDKSKIYDTTPLTQEDVEYTITVNGIPVSKAVLEQALGADITISLSEASVCNVSEGEKVISPSVSVSKYGVPIDIEVIENVFDITLIDGYIKIEPRELIVESGSNTWIYDGRAHSYNSATIPDEIYDKFVELGFSINVVSARSSITNVGFVKNEISEVRVRRRGIDEVRTGNVILTINEGTLTVVPRKLTVISGDAQKKYDGTPLIHKYFTVEDDPELGNYPNTESYSQLEMDVQPTNFTGSQTEPGSSDNTIEGVQVLVNGIDAVAAGNVIVEMQFGTLTVTDPERKPITLIIFGTSREYNGKRLEEALDILYLSGLAEGHSFALSEDGLPKIYVNMPAVPDTISPDDLREDKGNGEKAQYVTFHIVDKNGNDVSHLYYLDPQIPKGQNTDEYYIAEIKNRHIQLTTGSRTAPYKENAMLSDNTVTLTEGPLAEGDRFEIWGTLTTLYEKGICDNELLESQVRIYNADGQRVDSYYDIEIVFGTLEFT